HAAAPCGRPRHPAFWPCPADRSRHASHSGGPGPARPAPRFPARGSRQADGDGRRGGHGHDNRRVHRGLRRNPLAIGVLIFQGPAGWESASNRYALLVAEIIAAVTTVVFGLRIARFGQPGGNAPAEMAARTYHARYLTDADFDARSRVLPRRAQDAIDAVASSQVCRAGLLDLPAASAALTYQEWDIALALREQARLRARRAELSAISTGTLPGRQF